MPTYEFSCPEGHDFEKFYRSMSAAPAEVACPVCGRPAIRKVSGGAGLLFKGSGFYITDYGKDGKKDQKSASSASEGSGSAEPAKSDSSNAAKSDSSAPASGSSGTGTSTGSSAGSSTGTSTGSSASSSSASTKSGE